MLRCPRLLDLCLLLMGLALYAWSSQPVLVKSAPPARTPRAQLPEIPPVPSPAPAVWLKRGLQLHVQSIRSGAGPKAATLKLTLRNDSLQSAFIPGTFCQEGDQADWWSHAVRVRVSDGRQNWVLGPSYGMRELHEHGDMPLVIKPGSVLQWEFRLGELTQDCDGEGVTPGWDELNEASRVSLICELQRPGFTVVSNHLRL